MMETTLFLLFILFVGLSLAAIALIAAVALFGVVVATASASWHAFKPEPRREDEP